MSTHLAPEIESVVLAMWGEPEEEITREVMARFNISYNQAFESVHQAIVEEIAFEDDYDEEWYAFEDDLEI